MERAHGQAGGNRGETRLLPGFQDEPSRGNRALFGGFLSQYLADRFLRRYSQPLSLSLSPFIHFRRANGRPAPPF